jgi:hypothetical protein
MVSVTGMITPAFPELLLIESEVDTGVIIEKSND